MGASFESLVHRTALRALGRDAHYPPIAELYPYSVCKDDGQNHAQCNRYQINAKHAVCNCTYFVYCQLFELHREETKGALPHHSARLAPLGPLPPFLFNASRPQSHLGAVIVNVGEGDPSYPRKQTNKVHSYPVRNCIGIRRRELGKWLAGHYSKRNRAFCDGWRDLVE